MKLLAQHGALGGERVEEALKSNIIDGVIFGPKDITADNLSACLTRIRKTDKDADLLFDPQFYAATLAAKGECKLGKLGEGDYDSYFRPRMRSQLEREPALIDDISRVLKFQSKLQLTALISPNIFIPRSFDSIEAVISKNFIRNARAQMSKLGDKRPLYSTLAISRDALNDKQELQEFLNELTALDDGPDGYYLLIGGSSRSEIFHADTIAAWMLINHSLNINGYKVINGYSDLMTPFLGAVGGAAGATGWFGNLRSFSLGRFLPAGGGRLPIPRYLSRRLINRITFTELDALREQFPKILNGLNTDELYDPEVGSEPSRSMEVFQSWQTIQSLNERLASSDLKTNLKKCLQAISRARDLYAAIPIALDVKSNEEHIDALQEGIELFAELAEIKLPVD